MNKIVKEDIQYIHQQVDFSQLAGKKVLITGATGLIGKLLVQSMLEWNRQHHEKIRMIALVRNEEKARQLFPDTVQETLTFFVSDVADIKPEDMGLDYIIHGASATASQDFVQHPVEVVRIALNGTIQLLELARINQVKGFIYLSSMEVYGTPSTDEKIDESYIGKLDALTVRNCYPESKRMCENLCADYASEYGIPTRIVRLTQTFGPGVFYQDGRVFAEFARCVLKQEDIILKTKGETKRCYLYTADAVTAILTVLFSGADGQAYNAANESTYCSIYEMALQAAELSPVPISVRIMEEDIQKFGFAPVFKMNLSVDKLMQLGWTANYTLSDMFERMIKSMNV